MSRSVQKVGALARAEFTVYDSSDQAVTGLLSADFQKLLSVNGISSGVAVTVTEISFGRYEATFTPSAVGGWYLLIRQATYNLRGWDESFDVNRAGSDIFSYIMDGYEMAQVFELIGAALSGKVSGAPFNPVFRSMDDTADRIASVCDAAGNRTSQVLTP